MAHESKDDPLQRAADRLHLSSKTQAPAAPSAASPEVPEEDEEGRRLSYGCTFYPLTATIQWMKLRARQRLKRERVGKKSESRRRELGYNPSTSATDLYRLIDVSST